MKNKIKFLKNIALVLLCAISFNCGTIYYGIKDGDFPQTEKTQENVNWLVIAGDIAAGVTFPIIAATPAGIISTFVYLSVDYVTGCLFNGTDSKIIRGNR